MSYEIELSLAVRECTQANGGKSYIRPPLSAPVLGALHKLARCAGLHSAAVNLTDDELCGLYATARKSSAGTKRMAVLLGNKYGETVTERPAEASNPFFAGTPSPAPSPAPSTAPSDDTRVLRDIANILVDIQGLRQSDTNLVTSIAQVSADMDNLSRETLASLPSLIQEALKQQTPTKLVIELPGEAPKPVGTVHRDTPRIIKYLASGVNVYLHGPAGSGKTTAARQAAEALNLSFYFAAKVESEYLLLGFRNAQGEAVRTPFREAYEHGGLFLLDEMDASSPGAIVALNAALANGICPFPDGTIKRHADFKCIAAGNTTLTGSSRQYTGRNQLDAASVDRFAFIEFGYDEVLERSLATNTDWVAYVQAVRAAINARALPKLVTPRATLDGCLLLAAGETWENVAHACIWKGLDAATVAQIHDAVPAPHNARQAA